MECHLWPLRGRARSIATALMIALGSFATLATSQVQPSLGDRAEGSFVLSRDLPGFAARFSFDANAAALAGNERVVLEVEHAEYWSPPAAPRSLEPAIERVDGGPAATWVGLRCFGVACLGVYEITFRWPTGVDASTVRVGWSVSAEITYHDAPDRDASLDIEILSVSDAGHPPTRFFEGEVVLGRHEAGTAQHVVIRSSAPIRTPISIEREAWRSPRDAPPPIVTVFVSGAARFRLLPATSKALPVPDRCLQSGCSFTFTLTISRQTPAPARVPWGLVSRDIAGLSAERYRAGSVG